MQRQFKQLPYFAIKAEGEGRIRKGICAVFGNVDSWGDRILPGAFSRTISEGKSRVKHLWNHSFSEPPTAVITELKEVSRDELPPEVLEYAPDAEGGLMVAREYLGSQKANEILEALDKGAITEMSFGYDVIRAEDVREDDRNIRELKELKLFDTSDVLWGMNPATVATGAKNLPLGIVVQEFLGFVEEVKAGRRNAESDIKLINAVHRAAVDLGCSECAGFKETDEEKAETVASDISLRTQRLQLQQLQTGILTI